MSPRVRLLERDRVTDGDGNIGVVRECMNHRTKDLYLGVKVLQGPKKGQWDKAWRYRPLLDWSDDGPQFLCINPDCARWFRRPIGSTQPYCRTCAEIESAEIRQRERETELFAGTRGNLARAKWDRKHGHPIGCPCSDCTVPSPF